MVGLWSMQAIIIHRIWCMYRRSKPVLILLVCTFLGQVTTSSTIIALDKSKNAAFPFVRDMLVCVPGGAKPFLEWYWAYLVFIIAFDVVAFTLALMEGIRYFRRTQLTEGSLVRILLRDSIFFPFLGLSVSIFALLAWRAVLPYPSVAVLMTLMALTSPILGSRLILNLRDAYYKPFAEEVNPGAVPSHRQLSSGPTIRTPIEIQRSVEVSRSHINDVQLQIFPIQKV
ncbi:hypothetical protein CC2G_009876 [Coprinopsis cinerea AmutBmut pab1-1]|nr:hypothetical protein CC2G_009876 [Coprinopsis cinerea AmutBmut pab1-1]